MTYEQFLIETSEKCQNCPYCCDNPCGACLAGGICDRFQCTCNDDPDYGCDEEDDQK